MTFSKRKILWLAALGAAAAAAAAGIRLWPGVRPRPASEPDRPATAQPGRRGLDALVLEGPELHASLQTRRIGSIRHLPPGTPPPENPHVSSSAGFVEAISRCASQGRLGSEGIRSVLYAVYTGERDVGFYGLEAVSVAQAIQREEAVSKIWARNASLGRAEVYRAGVVILVVWHDGVSPECWASVQASVAERLNAAGSPAE